MKVCLVCDYTAPGRNSMGAERMVEALAKGLIRNGHEVVMKIKPDSIWDHCPVVQIVPADCDIIHFNGWDPHNSPREFASYGIPWVFTLHGGGTEADPVWLDSMNSNPHAICVSKFISDRLSAPAFAWTCSDPRDFVFANKKKDYFLWMAGTDWGESKGLFSTIQLAKKMKFKLIIAGTGSNSMIIDQIKQFCDDKISYVGAINGIEKSQLLSNAKALILLSKVPDACPLTISEAMLSGTPVIGSSAGALPELILEGKTGFICKTNADFAKAILRVNKINPQDCLSHGLKNFSNTEIAKKYVHFYKNMIEHANVVVNK